MKRFILSLLLAFCFFYGLSQSENVALQEVLMKSVWTGCNKKGDIDQGVVKIRCSFSTDTLTILFKEKGEKYEIKSPYYISETAEVVFNEYNVGTQRTGFKHSDVKSSFCRFLSAAFHKCFCNDAPCRACTYDTM